MSTKKNKKSKAPLSFLNKRASFSYTLLTSYTAGIKLLGTEIKSIRDRRVNLTDAYAFFDPQGELWVQGIHIAPYEPAGAKNHNPLRKRKLLLTKKEIRKLKRETIQKRRTITVLRLFVNAKGLAKLEISSAEGKKLHDKRQSIKEREIKRRVEKSF